MTPNRPIGPLARVCRRARARRGFTLVNLVAVMGSLALAVALVQTDLVVSVARRSAWAADRVQARILAQTALESYGATGPITIDLGRARLELSPAPGPLAVGILAGGSSAAGRAVARVRIVRPTRVSTIELSR